MASWGWLWSTYALPYVNLAFQRYPTGMLCDALNDLQFNLMKGSTKRDVWLQVTE